MRSTLKNISVVIPVYNENHTTVTYIADALRSHGAEVIIVDDGSDKPYSGAIRHKTNKGYGATLLTGISHASNEIVVTMDGDGQHRVQDVLNLYSVWNMLEVDMIVGVRRISGEIWYRLFGRKFLNLIASLFAFKWLPDLNSGMRIFKKKIAYGYREILCPQFSFTTSLTLSMMCDNYQVEFFPIKVSHRTYGKSKVRVLKHGLITLYYIIRIGTALRTRRIRALWRKLNPFSSRESLVSSVRT